MKTDCLLLFSIQILPIPSPFSRVHGITLRFPAPPCSGFARCRGLFLSGGIWYDLQEMNREKPESEENLL
jgi:hypothetical protein